MLELRVMNFPSKPEYRQARLREALTPVACLIAFLAYGIVVLDISPHLPLIMGAAAAALMGWRLGHRWQSIEQGIIEGIKISLNACLILMAIGLLIGTWLAGGVVPIMVYYGLKLLTPGIFLVATCLICSVISLATGSSWSTAGTVGVALIGVAQGLGVPLPMVAGAIISGSYFGDKMSPLSDTTNLSPAVAGAELFEHIRHMTYTTVPSYIIALTLYALMGFFYTPAESGAGNLTDLLTVLEQNFNLSFILLLPPLLVIFMVVFRIPALPALLAGGALGGIMGMIFQGLSLQEVFAAAQSGYVSETGVQAVDELLTRGGLESMMSTIALILCAMSFGGIMERTGMLAAIANAILTIATTTGKLVGSVVLTCYGMNFIAPDQYLSIIVPGRMYKNAFQKAGLHPKNLSRILEDAGTLTSPLVPWNTCGAFMHAALLVDPFSYLPYAFLNLINPILSILYGITGWTMVPLDKKSSSPSSSSSNS